MLTKLCLNMIVKDEAANIERCLLALADHVACWVICDTGSSDATPALIREVFAARAIPGELHEIAFETFGQARNAALDIARASALRYDYLLLVDADMELTVADRDFARDLSAEVYMLRQDSGVAYWNARLLRRDAAARYVGVTHEYLDLKAGETRQLGGAAFIDHASGANRPGKARRDADLLRTALRTEQDPGLRARYAFYLANSLRDEGDDAEALRWFLKRAEAGHWHEEVFLSLADAGRLKARLGYADDDVLATLERATDACPTRAEALHEAARFCRDRALHERGLAFARRASAIPMPGSGLFLAEWVYRYGSLDELAVAAYCSGRHAESLSACDRLLAEPSLPAGERPRVEANRGFALAALRADAATREREAPPPAIPRILHFVVGLDSGFGGKPFAFVHAMAIVSALRVNEGFAAHVHYEFEPQGAYWEMVRPLVTCVPIVAPRTFRGHPVEHFAHRADICRLEILLEHGGIYLDIDTICQKPFAPLLDGSVVMGSERMSDGTVVGLCNATIIAPAGAAFLRNWLDSDCDFTVWNQFSVRLPMALAEQHPDLVRIEPHTSFFWPPWDERGVAALFLEDGAYPEAYCFHLWESKSWDHLRWLDADRVRTLDTAYNRVARRFAADFARVGADGATAGAATWAAIGADGTGLVEAFTTIYERDVWSNGSGQGSKPANTVEYRAFVEHFIRANRIRTVVDLGCGDWQSSRLMDWSDVDYTGFDVVTGVIETNRARFAGGSVSFELFRSIDQLPRGDLLLAKEVLQHLPTRIVQDYVAQIRRKYRFALLTNTIDPAGAANGDVEVGGYRPLRLADAPFAVPGATVLGYTVRSGDAFFRNEVYLVLGL